MGRLLRCSVLFPFLVAPGSPADAAEWRPIGPLGGEITSIVVDPEDGDRIYSIANFTLFRSDDRGRRWHELPVDAPLAIAVAPGGALYVGGALVSHRSTDHGESWQVLDGLEGDFVYAIAVDPHTDDVVYALTAEGLLESRDGGSTWQVTGAELPYPHGAVSPGLIADAAERGTFYALVNDRVFKSTDAASTWRQSGSGLPIDCGLPYQSGVDPTPRHACALTIAADAASPSALYVGTDGSGVYRSLDRGETWTALGGLLAERAVRSIAVDPSGSGRLYAAVADGFGGGTNDPIDRRPATVFRSDDGGGFWREAADGLPQAIAIVAVDPRAPDAVYAGTDGAGVFGSDDGAQTWAGAELGLSGSCLTGITAVPAAPTRLVVSTLDASPRLLFNTSGSREWHTADVPVRTVVQQVVVDPNDPETLYGATLDAQVIKSVDGGRTWSLRDPFPIAILHLAADPASPTVLYAACGSCGVVKSVDGAIGWQEAGAHLGFIARVAVDVGSGAIYALSEGRAYRSTDGGASWDEVTPVPHSLFAEITIARSSPPALFASTLEGIYVSRDDAETWEKVDLPETSRPGLFRIAVSPQNASTVYALANGQLFRSDDAGADWTAVADRLPGGSNDLTIDPEDPRIVYAATCANAAFELRQEASSGGSDGGGCAVAPGGMRSALPAQWLPVALLAGARRLRRRSSSRLS